MNNLAKFFPMRSAAMWGASILAAALVAGAPGNAQDKENSKGEIPKRPETLKFPALNYEPPEAAKFRVPLASGPVAYVVPDRELPLVNIAVYVRTGEYNDPPGKEGLASLTGNLLVRGGIQSKTAEELEERLAFLAAQLNSAINDSQGSVTLNLLSKDLDEGLKLLREVLSVPRFQDNRIALRKQQTLQAMKERNDNSSAIESREAGFLAYGTNFWINRYSTAASIDAIQRADLKSFHRSWFAPSNFVVAASGDFDRDAMVGKLETLFGNWPFPGETPRPVPTNTAFADPGIYIVDKDVAQGRVNIMLPGVRRDNPDYFAVLVMNDILGGGGFTSRIMSRVRSDEGLAYDAHTIFPGGIYYPLTFSAGFQSKPRTVAYAISIVLEEIKRVCAEPVSDQEINTSQRGFIERFPRAFGTKAQVATVFAQDEFTGRYIHDPSYWKEYRARVQAVKKDDISRVAQKYLAGKEPVIVIVGQKDQIVMGHPDHPVKLADLSPGGVKDWPLRDPLTMKPMDQSERKSAKSESGRR
jgi:predicted Zn-dependent peptidase